MSQPSSRTDQLIAWLDDAHAMERGLIGDVMRDGNFIALECRLLQSPCRHRGGIGVLRIVLVAGVFGFFIYLGLFG